MWAAFTATYPLFTAIRHQDSAGQYAIETTENYTLFEFQPVNSHKINTVSVSNT
jgi:hypothetical protein